MVAGRFKSGRFRRVQRRLPGGRTVTHFKEGTPKQARCSETGQVLHGIPRTRKHLPKSMRRPERPYGGVLSSGAMRSHLKAMAHAHAPQAKVGFVVGSLCLKIAGRDAKRKCVIVELDGATALIDGETRRRKCNVRHLEPLGQSIDLKKGASHTDVVTAFKKLNIELAPTTARKAATRPRRLRKVKEHAAPKTGSAKQLETPAPEKSATQPEKKAIVKKTVDDK